MFCLKRRTLHIEELVFFDRWCECYDDCSTCWRENRGYRLIRCQWTCKSHEVIVLSTFSVAMREDTICMNMFQWKKKKRNNLNVFGWEATCSLTSSSLIRHLQIPSHRLQLMLQPRPLSLYLLLPLQVDENSWEILTTTELRSQTLFMKPKKTVNPRTTWCSLFWNFTNNTSIIGFKPLLERPHSIWINLYRAKSFLWQD